MAEQTSGQVSFADVVRRAWRGNHLLSALLELTYRCNLDCFFCYNDLGLEGRPMSRDDYFRLLDELRDLGTLNLILSGGEPLAHPDFLAIGARARELGFVVRIKSNGHALRGEMLARTRDEIDPFMVEVSLHGAQAETHDRQTRVAGSFDRLMANLAEAHAAGLRLQINSTLTRWNEDEAVAMLDIASELGVRIQFDPIVTPRDDGDTTPLAIGASEVGLQRLFDERRHRAEEAPAGAERSIGRQADELPGAAGSGSEAGDKHCGAGSATIAVDPFGTVYPCVQWRRAVGNLHDSALHEIWADSGELDRIRGLGVEIKQRLEDLGAAKPKLGFCPGDAYARSGDPLPPTHEPGTSRPTSPRRKPQLLPVIR